MALYFNPQSGLVEIDSAVYEAWQAAGNPKADYYQPLPEQPGSEYFWNGQQWQAPPPPLPTPDWPTFKALALNSATLNEILASAYQSCPVAAGALAPGLLRAENNEYNDFKISWKTICDSVNMSSEEILGFQEIARNCNLPLEFIELLNPQN